MSSRKHAHKRAHLPHNHASFANHYDAVVATTLLCTQQNLTHMCGHLKQNVKFLLLGGVWGERKVSQEGHKHTEVKVDLAFSSFLANEGVAFTFVRLAK